MTIQVDPDWWRTLFDGVYLVTDARSVCDDDLTRKETAIFIDMLGLQPGARVLDLCGGHGRHSIELAQKGMVSSVVDYSDFLIEHGQALASDRGLNIDFLQADARKTGLPDSSFDCALVLGNSLGYLSDKDADREILEETRRLLTPCGKILVDVTDGRSVEENFVPSAWHEIGEDTVVCRQREILDGRVNAREMVICKKDGLIRDKTYSIKLYEPEQLLDLAERAGFENARLHTDFSPNHADGDLGFMNCRMVLTAVNPEPS